MTVISLPTVQEQHSFTLNRFLALGLLTVLMMEAGSTSETSVNRYRSSRRSKLEDSHLLTHSHEDLDFT
jgi:hypothetical protein